METNSYIQNLNNKYDNLIYNKQNPDLDVPAVCLICDRFVETSHITYSSISFLRSKYELLCPITEIGNIPDSLLNYYTFSNTYLSTLFHQERSTWFKKIIISPRCVYVIRKPRNRSGFITCSTCYNTIRNKHKVPFFSIVNNFYFGNAPDCLTALTDVELAFLSPVQTYGYCFTYTGGTNKKLKGSATFVKIAQSSVAQSVLQLDHIGLTNNIVIVLQGNMTPAQIEKASKRGTIDTCKIRTAFNFITVNNNML